MKGRKPTFDEKKYLDAIAELGCVVCLRYHGVYSPAEIHHLDGKTKKGAHFKAIPLCHRHHRKGRDCEEYTSRHPYKARFEERYGSEEDLLEATRERLAGGH